jgi:hypothetical protein
MNSSASRNHNRRGINNTCTISTDCSVMQCVTSDSEMNVPGISSGVTASGEHLLKTDNLEILRYIGNFGLNSMNIFSRPSRLKFRRELCSVVFTSVTRHTRSKWYSMGCYLSREASISMS